MSDEELWERRLARERAARKQAEQLLERKSLELYRLNLQLQNLNLNLENLVAERTRLFEAANEALTREIHVRQDAENALLRGAAELRTVNADLEEFAYVASHDLQEPLRKINSFADLLIEECRGQLGETGVDYLQRMQSAARRMDTMIRDLLQISRASSWSTGRQNVSLNEVLQGVLKDLEALVQESGARIDVGQLGTVFAAPVAVTHLLINLLGNAMKYRRKSVPSRITVDSRPVENNLLEVIVQDNGIGFDQQYAERIFKPFQRLHSRAEYPGTGIGLAVCRKIVERHGGRISAEGRVGHGARFRFTLPMGTP